MTKQVNIDLHGADLETNIHILHCKTNHLNIQSSGCTYITTVKGMKYLLTTKVIKKCILHVTNTCVPVLYWNGTE